MTGALLPAEQRLVDHAAAGTGCVLTAPEPGDRRVRAEVLYALFTEDKWRLHARGVRLRGAVIEEPVDFEHTALRAPLVMERSELRGGFTFRSARASAIELVDCRIGGAPDASRLEATTFRLSGSVVTTHLSLAGAVVGGDLDLDAVRLLGADAAGTALLADQLRVGGGAFLGGLQAQGTVRLLGASVGGNLDLDGAHLVAVDTALFADGLRVGGGLFLGKGLHAVGAVRLAGAMVDGQVSLVGATIGGTDGSGNSLVGDGLRIGNDAFLHEGFTAAGAVRLAGATVGGNLEMDGAEVAGADGYGDALVAHGLAVQGDMFVRRGTVNGAIRLAGATVGGQLSLGGTTVAGTDDDGCALVADGLRVGGDMFVHDGFDAVGAVRLAGTTVDGNLEMHGARIAGTDDDGDAVVATRLRVGGDALLGGRFHAVGRLRFANAAVDGQLELAPAHGVGVVLTGARCGELADDPASWPPEGELALRGFRFGTLAAGTGWRRRLAWIRRQGLVRWSPDPYEQLAGYYTSVGDETAFRHVRIAKHDDELRHLRATRKPGTFAYRFWRRPFGWLLGYGYRRHRAGWLLVATLLAAGLLFRQAEVDGGMVPDPPLTAAAANADANVGGGGGAPSCGVDHPCFNALVYGADVVLPVVDLGQDERWRPIETRSGGHAWVWARWVFIAIGWVLASIFVAAFAGLVPLS